MCKNSITILIISFISLLFSCQSLPQGQHIEDIQGLWKDNNGTALRITGKEYELVNTNAGIASYGTVKLYMKRGEQRIEWIHTLSVDLAKTGNMANTATINDRKIVIKDFQKNALKEYLSIHGISDIPAYDTFTSYGGHYQNYSVINNVFSLGETGTRPDGTRSDLWVLFNNRKFSK